jgi:PKD repeat protein
VQFSDLSVGDVRSWSWDFGDGNTSVMRNPSHQYASDGTYTVTLTVTGPVGDDTETKVDWIVVSASPTVPVKKKKSGGCSCTVDCGPSSARDILGYLVPFALLSCAYLGLRRRGGKARI